MIVKIKKHTSFYEHVYLFFFFYIPSIRSLAKKNLYLVFESHAIYIYILLLRKTIMTELQIIF